MPRKNKRYTGRRDIVNLSTENDFKYACLPTHEPNKHNINKCVDIINFGKDVSPYPLQFLQVFCSKCIVKLPCIHT